MRQHMLTATVIVSLLACSNAGTVTSSDSLATGDVTTADTVTAPDTEGPDASIQPELPLFEVVDILFFETVPDVPELNCLPGEGCFLDKCTENSQCQSGWCVEHMGEGVCSQGCSDECPQGWSCKPVGASDPNLVYVCVSNHSNLCKPCASTDGCKAVGGADDVCVDYGAEGFYCGGGCAKDDDCPWGFSCLTTVTVDGIDTLQCVADAGVCPCTAKSVELSLWTPCNSSNEFGSCDGKRVCTEDGLTACNATTPAQETCNGLDDDCDDDIDEPLQVEGDYVNLCDDGNECTEDNCLGETGCELIALSDAECKDGDPCTVADHCTEGLCLGNPVVCDDDNECTDDSCDGSGGCLFENNSASCDDGDACTVADQCSGGECGGLAIPCDCQNDADCDQFEDGDACNGTLVCNVNQWPYKCQIDPATISTCPGPDAGPDAICLKAACDPVTGACSLAPDHQGFACEDGNVCTLADTCVEGTCTPGFDRVCHDENLCTDDSCDPLAGCLYSINEAPCIDGNACTTGDQCVDGNCVGGNPLSCDDGNACNGVETCDTKAGCIPGTPLECPSDNDPCNGIESCHPVEGCLPGEALDCDDGNPCTSNVCYPTEGCVTLVNKKPCDDEDVCTVDDKCSEGHCFGGSPIDCNDSNICTTDWCHPVDGCSHDLNGVPCNDDDLCSTDDHCHLGGCIGSGILSCNDGNVCTDDACHAKTGCSFANNTANCDDGNACTTGDSCASGWCLSGGPLDCDDGDPCTVDLCDSNDGCVYSDSDEGTPCGDMFNDICKLGNCLCVPNCDGKECGNDGCGGVCGECSGQDACNNGICICQPSCDGMECGDDGCGDDCGPCQDGSYCDNHQCKVGQCGGSGVLFDNGCIWNVAGGDNFIVPQGVTNVSLTMIGGGGGSGKPFYYPGGGGGSGNYIVNQSKNVTPGQSLLVQVGSGGGQESSGGQTKFGDLVVNGGKKGNNHTAGSGQPSARGGDGGSGGGAGYTNSANGGGSGSGTDMQGYAGAGGQPSANQGSAAYRGAGYGAGGGSAKGTSGYNSSCGGLGGSNGGNGQTVGGCGGGGGGAGGLNIPGFNNPPTSQTTTGTSGAVWVKFN
jgi:hypothetical protein